MPASHDAGRVSASSSKTVVKGIPAAFTVTQSAKAKCTWKVTGQPGSVTAGAGGTNNCTELIDGVWSKTGTDKVTAKVTQSGKTTTDTVTVTVKASTWAPSGGRPGPVSSGSSCFRRFAGW
jgi:hypothetical protein